jgi:DNA-binding MarR family transcriptional regulator
MTSSSARPRRAAHTSRRIVQIDTGTSVVLDRGLQFMRTLWVTVHALQKASKRMTRTLRVTGPQRLVIRIIGLAPGLSAGALAKMLHLHPSTLTGVLKRLEAQRLVRRERAADDARRAVLHLTPAGERLNVAMAGTVEAGVRTTLARVPPDDQRIAQELLEAIAEQLEADGGSARPKSGRRRTAT